MCCVGLRMVMQHHMPTICPFCAKHVHRRSWWSAFSLPSHFYPSRLSLPLPRSVPPSPPRFLGRRSCARQINSKVDLRLTCAMGWHLYTEWV
jgi:hypothetical protein